LLYEDDISDKFTIIHHNLFDIVSNKIEHRKVFDISYNDIEHFQTSLKVMKD